MKKLLLILGVIASVNASADAFSGKQVPECSNSSTYAFFWQPGGLDMKPGDCYKVTRKVSHQGYQFSQELTLIFQLDGNVALYAYDSYYNSTSVQGLSMENKGGINFVYQEDNNLVLYAPNKVLWAADSDHNKYDTAGFGFDEDVYASGSFWLTNKQGNDAKMPILHASIKQTI